MTYAPNGDVLSSNDSANGNWTYGYDDFNRLLSSNKNSGAAVYGYVYDRFGNRLQQNGPNTMLLTFTGNNNRMDGYTYDLAGNVTYDKTSNYTYDAENRIASVTGTLGTTAYVYDASGRRVRKTVSGTSVDFLYDLNGNQIAEINSTGTLNRSEIYAGSRHLATYNNGTTYFSHADWLGTERVRSNVGGSIYETCSSLPFGDALACSSPDASPMHFTGKEHDTESGLDNFGARYSSSGLGRFMSPDPLDASAHPGNPQSWNRYTYTFNNPLAFVDVKGKCSAPAVGKGQVGVCIDLYISSRTIKGLGLGDGRGPKANDPKATYRAEIQLVADPAKHSVAMVKNDPGVSSAIVPIPPIPIIISNKGTSNTTVSQPTVDENGSTHFNVSNESLNGLAFLPGAPKDPILLSLPLVVTSQGTVGVDPGGSRSAYPSLEVYSYDSSGNATPILQLPETTPSALGALNQLIQAVPPANPSPSTCSSDDKKKC